MKSPRTKDPHKELILITQWRHPRLFPATLQPEGLVSGLTTWMWPGVFQPAPPGPGPAQGQEQKQHFSITPAGLLGCLEHHLRALPRSFSPLGQTGRCPAAWRSRTTPSTSRGPSPTAWLAPTSARPPTPSGPGRAWWKSMSQVGKHSACPERGGGGGGELLSSTSQRCLLNVCLTTPVSLGGRVVVQREQGLFAFSWVCLDLFLLSSRHLFLSYTKRPSVSFPSSSFLLRARTARWTC